MNKRLLSGYLIKDVLEINNIEMILAEMKENALGTAIKAYKALLSMQIERITDEIVFGQYQLPDGKSIFDIAVQETQRRILYGDRNMQQTEYNFHIDAQILIGKFDEKTCVFIQVNTLSEDYKKGFTRIKELIPYDIYEDEIEPNKEKRQFWQSIDGKYNADTPLYYSLLQYENLVVEPDELTFRSSEKRAKEKAKEKVLNHLLSCYSCNEQIQPHKLMEFTLQALNHYNSPDVQERFLMEKARLEKILPEITVEMITKINTK